MATLTELNRKTSHVVRPVIHGGETVTLTNQGQAVAKIVPIEAERDLKKAFEALRSIGPIKFPARK